MILALGDVAYPIADGNPYEKCFDPYWGPFAAFGVIGNHDYDTEGGRAYFRYFGSRAGTEPGGYYALRRGAWKIVVLNSELESSNPLARAQLDWLRAELRQGNEHVIAAFHRPMISSGLHGAFRMRDLWVELYRGGVDIVLVGHEHFYERFKPLDPEGQHDPAFGIPQFIVGTGGATRFEEGARAPRRHFLSETEPITSTWGVLKLSLGSFSEDGCYSWQFVPTTATELRDYGTGKCHDKPVAR